MVHIRRPARAAALLLVVAPLLAACASESSGSTDDVVPAAVGITVVGAESIVQLPHGRLTITVSDAAEVDPADLARSGDEPVESGEAVGVGWTWEPGVGVPTQQSGFLLADDVPAEIAVVVDGVTRDLGPAYSTSDAVAPADAYFVPADEGMTADEVTVEVDFDGLVQRVRADGSERDAGVAAPLYDDIAPQPVECDLVVEPAEVTAAPTCDLAVLDLPYVTGLGWAEPEGAWTVVDTTVRLDTVTVGDDDVPVAGQSETVRLDGAEPEEVLLEDGTGATLRTQTVFAVADGDAGDLQIVRTLQVEAPDGGSIDVTLSATAAVGSR